MEKTLLFTFCTFLALSISAQTSTINIDWGFSSNSTAEGDLNTDRTIEEGDTVIWTWVGNGSHNVISDGSSGNTETFSSGNPVPTPASFSYTFNNIGSTNFRCSPHAFMNGTINVVAEGTLSVSNLEQLAQFNIAPNPAKNNLNIELPETNSDMQLEVFDVLGKRVHKSVITQLESSVNVSSWKSGVYLVRIFNDKLTQTKRFIKQ